MQKNASRAVTRVSLPLLILLLALFISILIMQPIPSLTEEKRTSGNLTFTDGSGIPVSGVIEISMTGAPSGGRSGVNRVTWRNAPNAWIYFDAHEKKSISINLRISGDSPAGRVSLEDYGASAPGSIAAPAPGSPVKYVELRSSGVSFADADVIIHYKDDELKGQDVKSLVIYSYSGGTWIEQPTKVDAVKNTMSVTVDSLTVFAISTLVPRGIVVRDAGNKPLISGIRTYDNSGSLKKDARSYALEPVNVPDSGELEVNALESKNVSLRLKLNGVNSGDVVLDDFGKKNPVLVPLPGKAVKYVEIGARNISFSSAGITIRYTEAELNGGNEDTLTIFHWNGASWDAVPAVIDKVNKTLRAETASLSLWGVATLYRQTLRCDTGTSTGADTTNFSCGTASTPYDIGLLMDDTAGTSTIIRIGTAGNGPWAYAYFINNTAFSSDVNVTGYSASISMRVTTSGRTDYGWYELGYYDPNGVAGNMPANFVGLFNSTAASTTAITQTSYAISFRGRSGIIPAGYKLAVRVWTNATGGTDRPYFYSFSTAAAANSSIDISIAYANSYISGYVTNKSSGLPLSGATVQTNTSLTATTDANGFYNFTGLTNGLYIINASLQNYATGSINVTINDNVNNTANISLTPVPTYTLSGYVTNSSSGAAISGATVTTNTSLTTSTNATGYYNFTVGNGTYLITASYPGYNDNSTTRTVNGAAVGNANIQLTPIPPAIGKLFVGTNRYVVLDAPRTGTAQSPYVTPYSTDAFNTNYWTGSQTTIGIKSLFLDSSGKPLSGKTINFTIYYPNNSVISTGTNITDAYGVASYYKSLDEANYYGNWTVKGESGGIYENSSFVYNWWGCAWNQGSCGGQHSGVNPGQSGTTSPNSPYTASWEQITNAQGVHSALTGAGWADNYCTICHQSYDGNPTTGITAATTTKDFYTPDVHRNIRCDNASCHNPGASFANHNAGTITIGSCTSASCHPLRSDISMKSTLNGAVSNYSNGSSGGLYDDYHTPNSTVPCIICHGPMHNVTKPDESQRFIRNSDTEDTHCTSCHQTYNKHNGIVNCTLCHSDDVHEIQVFARNATGGAYYMNVTHLANPPSNCTLCHQGGTSFFNSLENNASAGNYTKRRDPPQVAAPVEHSQNDSAGKRWNQTPGYWTNTLQFSWCIYCHGNSTHSAAALGRPAGFDGNNVVNSSISLTSSWCSSCHWQGYTNGSDTYAGTISAFTGEPLPVPPEITGNSTYANQSNPAYFNHSGISIKSDISCYGCHRNGTSAVSITGFVHNLTDVSTRVSGPDCIGCHDYNKTDTDALHRINNSDMKKGVHANLNKNATNYAGVSIDNKKCWGCHSTNGTEPRPYYPGYYNMGDRFANPYKCYDCHNSTRAYANVSSAPVVREHFKGGGSIRAASNATDNSSSCVACHDLNELKVTYLESDIYNAGMANASHYTTNRTALRTWDAGRAANCSYCHQNTSTAFAAAMLDPAYNASIGNHSTGNSPVCYNSTCHNSGWIHNSTLTRPALNSTNASSYCRNCHTDKWKHNGTLDCSSCHFNASSRDTIHPVKYLLQSASYGTDNSTAVTCITCHQTTAVDSKLILSPPKIPSPLHHSDNTSNGSLWNSTAYWTPASQLNSCNYCHGDTKHNSTALGLPSGWQGNNAVNSSLSSGTWCASCHFQNYSSGSKSYGDMTRTMISANVSVPPEITNGTYARKIFNRTDYYNHSLKGYTDDVCRLCHGVNLSSGVAITGFVHNVTEVSSCTGCHYSWSAMNNTTRPDRYVDQGMYNTSLHRSLSCENCHTKGHRNMGARKACEDCHAVQATPITDKDRHNITAKPSTYFIAAGNVVTITDCTTCHSAALYNTATATYGFLKPKDCDYCHTYPDKYYN